MSEKGYFEKYCSCDKACQFSALQGTPRRSYLENLTIDNKFINKRVRLFIHQTCVQNVLSRKRWDICCEKLSNIRRKTPLL